MTRFRLLYGAALPIALMSVLMVGGTSSTSNALTAPTLPPTTAADPAPTVLTSADVPMVTDPERPRISVALPTTEPANTEAPPTTVPETAPTTAPAPETATVSAAATAATPVMVAEVTVAAQADPVADTSQVAEVSRAAVPSQVSVAVRQDNAFQATPLLPPPPKPAWPGQPPYKHFTDCKQAVDYLFYGRDDYARAVYVVHRESRYVPTAVSRTGALGCAQLLSPGILAKLHGPWDDPFWNVLALKLTVDDPVWGWCHWDVKNYCEPGGDW